ncbi:MAG: hypothetical protein ACK4MU_09250, partial [Thermomonas sp.]
MNATLAGNSARVAGGAVLVDGASASGAVLLSGCRLLSNSAAQQGGGLYAAHTTCPGTFVTLPGTANVTAGQDTVPTTHDLTGLIGAADAVAVGGRVVSLLEVQPSQLVLLAPWTAASASEVAVARAPRHACVSLAAGTEVRGNRAFAGGGIFWEYDAGAPLEMQRIACPTCA